MPNGAGSPLEAAKYERGDTYLVPKLRLIPVGGLIEEAAE